MKKIIFTLLAMVGTTTFAQNSSRSIQEFIGISRLPSSFLAERNSTAYFMGIRNSDDPNIILAHGYMDANSLDVGQYQYLSLPLSKDSFTLVNGINIVGGEAEICLLKNDVILSGRRNIVFIKVNLQSNTVISRTDVNGQFGFGFLTTAAQNEKLIVYGYDYASTSWKRFSKGINTAPEVEDVNLSLNALGNSYKLSEVIYYQDVEYAALHTATSTVSIVKRNGAGDYSMVSVPLGSPQLWDFDAIDGNGMIVTANNKFIRVNADLSIQSEHTFASPTNYSTTGSLYEMVPLNSGYKIYGPTAAGGQVLTFNENFELINTFKLHHIFQPYGTVNLNNKKFIYGQMDVPYASNSFQNAGFSALAMLDSHQDIDLIEHSRKFETDLLTGFIGNHPNTFRNWSNAAALNYRLNNIPRSLLYTDSEFLIGKGEEDEVVGIYQRFEAQQEIIVGPMPSGSFDENVRRDRHNRSYHVTKQMVEDHITAIQNGDANYVMPFDIKYWPGNGNANFGEAARLAPFNDVNGNGIYEPSLGDFPTIYGDNCILSIYHTPSRDYDLSELEVHRYVFTAKCDTSEILDKTVFVKTNYINRGSRITDAYLGNFIDFDLGFYTDDYVGTHVGLSMVYAYNGDLYDETNGSNLGFQDTIPAVGKLFLSGMKLEDNNIDDPAFPGESPAIYNYNSLNFGDGIIDNEYYTLTASTSYANNFNFPYSDPTQPSHWYYSVQGLANDGSVSPYGQVGRFVYLGDSDPYFTATDGVIHSNDVSEFGNSFPGDRRAIMSSGPGLVESGDTVTLLSAYLVSFGDLNDPKGPSVSQLFTDAAKLKAYYANNDLGCGLTFNTVSPTMGVKNVEKLDFLVYPNPFQNELVIQHDFKGKVNVRITNMNQQVVLERDSVSNYEVLDLGVSAGVYFVELTSANGVIVKKIIKR